MGDIAHMLHTPIPEVLEMELGEIMEWHAQACRIGSGGQKTNG